MRLSELATRGAVLLVRRACLPSNAAHVQDGFVEIRDTRYAKTSDGVYIAYQTNGDGPIDIAFQLDWFGNVDLIWEAPLFGRLFPALSRFSRLILHDRRATGLSTGTSRSRTWRRGSPTW